ncbi:UNVERIFIED_ORG: ppGpp synthetase/RelA/SpoT-type nucleotidyltransferase [Atlantibacter hermannii]|nr:ppGpp synthetase/RelA/SpoT-type nucleotidyltransferase [Atlantibacter hermannii]
MNDYLDEYGRKIPLYTALMEQTRTTLIKMLENEGVSLFSVEGRVKTKESIELKISRKTYINPMNDIEDLCGVRVICYYESDLDHIENVIKREYEVISESNKQKEMDVDRFGYSSRHFIVRIKDGWLAVPTFRELGGLKVEIQIRTMLMHAWAAISHKLLYKQEGDAPREIKRNLSKLSALIELADEKFDTIKRDKAEYVSNLNISSYGVVINEDLNLDNLIALIGTYFTERVVNDDDISQVLHEILEFDKTVSDFEVRIKKCMPFLNAMEKEESNYAHNGDIPMWEVSGLCRTILDLTCDEYFYRRWGENTTNFVVQITKRYRGYINKDK